MINVELLKTICATPGAPGYEQRIRELVVKEVTPLVDEVHLDAMGNVIAIKKGKTPKRAMVAAHMDEIGFMVSHIDEEGFIRFVTLGGFDPKTLTSQRVIVHGTKDLIGIMGAKPIHIMKPEERKKVVPISDYFVDVGLPKSEVEKYVSIGDTITRERELIEIGECVNSKSLDNRVSVFILIEALRELKEESVPYDIYGAFTVQEEVGLRGATTVANGYNPDFSFGMDVTIAFDTPSAQPHEMVTRLGKGTAIKIKDGSTICDFRMVAYLKKLAAEQGIPWQPEVLPAGGTDTGALQRASKGGSIAGAVSIPLRNMHQTIEMVHKSDIRATIDLLKAGLTNLDKYDWSFNGLKSGKQETGLY